MTQNKIKTTLSKQGKFIFFTNAKGDRQSANANFSNLPDEILGKEVDAYQEGNKLTKVIWEGKEYEPLNQVNTGKMDSNEQGNRLPHHNPGKNRRPGNQQHHTQGNRQNSFPSNNTQLSPARAPYNFIPQPLLRAPVLLPETKPERFKAFDRYLPDLLSGSISFDWETLTHAFFGGQHKKTKKTFILNGRAVIPSASQRGLLRAAMAIASHGKFGPIDKDRRFYYRLNTNVPAEYTIKAGLLQYENGRYTIYPCRYENVTQSIDLDSYTSYGPSGEVRGIRYGRWTDGNDFIVKPLSAKQDQQKIWRINVPDNLSENIELDDTDIRTFKYDYELRSSAFSGGPAFKKYMDLVALAKEHGAIPVFYIQDAYRRIFIGNTKGFRLPYSQSLDDLINRGFRSDENGLDFAEGIFGTLDGPDNQAQRGRIRIENAYGPKEIELEAPRNLGILLSPKPSSGQLYLEQPKGVNTRKENQKNYSMADAKLRGRKLYHHRIFKNGNPDYFTDRPNSMQQDLNNIRTIKPQSTFHARLHFMNLLPEELGALLWVLDLPEGYAHKLGMGKTLGLGSMKINNIQLNVCNTKSLYENVFDESGELALPETSTFNQTDQEFKYYKQYFEDFMVKSLKDLGDECEKLWNAKNMQYYKAMLDTTGKDQADWHRKTNYMGGVNERDHPDRELWRQKAVLPHALFVRQATEEPFSGNANPYA